MIIAILSCCFNGSVIDGDSVNASTDPDNNFYGTVEDHYRTAQIESILIGGKYEGIPVYQDVSKSMINKKDKTDELIDPKQNKILINLKDIKSIDLKHAGHTSESSLSINNKTYVQIIVTFISGTKKDFLIETSRRITCNERDKGPEKEDATIVQKRDLNFTHIKKLTIIGYKSDNKATVKETFSERNRPSNEESLTEQKNKLRINTAQILNSIENNIKNLPTDNPTLLETMRQTILILLKSLRDQLQKFLDMVK